jgi:SAM-dependent methyltransferase
MGLNRLIRKIRRNILRDEPSYYDMFEHPGERYQARLYLHFIRWAFDITGQVPPLTILDAGCQSGRLAIPLASDGHVVLGVDRSAVALRRADRHAKEQHVSLRLIRSDLSRWLPRQPANAFDVVLCTEVLYLCRNHRLIMRELIRVLKPGGLCFISHRPPTYYLLEASERQDAQAIDTIRSGSEGVLFGSYYNWQDRSTLEDWYRSLHVTLLAIRPIGVLSIWGVCPDRLEAHQRELLFRAETDPQLFDGNFGRYLLAIGIKPKDRSC